MLIVDKEQTSKWKSMGRPKALGSYYTKIGRLKGLNLYYQGSKDHSQFHLVDDDCIHHYMGYFKRITLAGVSGWAQIAVQRSNQVKGKGLPESIFFQYALLKHGTLFSDKKQTEAGRYLWETKLIPGALSVGFYVYAYAAEKESFKRIKKLGKYPVEVWAKKNNANRLVISLTPLRRK